MARAVASEPRPLIGAAVVAAVLGLGWFARNRNYIPPPPGTPPPFRFIDATKQSRLDHVHQKMRFHPSLKNIEPLLSAPGAAVAVVDYDEDGWMDVYLTNGARGSRNRLFRNNHDGTFTDVAAKAGLADVNQDGGSTRPLFFDYDNDGHKDLLLLAYPCVKLFHNDGRGHFSDVTKRSGLRHCGNTFAANAIDYDGDGFLDLVIADYYKPVDLRRPDTTKFMPDAVIADNGGPVAVYHNNRDGTFTRVPGDLGIKTRGWVWAVGAYDLRGTGRQDLYLSEDFGPSALLLNEGGGRFSDDSGEGNDPYNKSAMGAAFAEIDNDGRTSIYVSDTYEPAYKVDRNSLFKSRNDGSFKESAQERGVAHCGMSWGAQFADLGNTGWQDLVVVDGMISADPKKDYWYSWSVMRSAARELAEDARHYPPIGDSSYSGYQRKCVFQNIDGHFTDVSAATPLGSDLSDGKGLALIDLMNDGRLSLVEAVQGGPARLYRNVSDNKNHWIGFSLKATRSNQDAWGAEVEVRLKDGRRLTRQLSPANGFASQSDPRLHFGLGPQADLDEVVVRWPSGRTQTLSGLALDRYHVLTEP